jgi:Domain of unknown function (DUF4276)
MARRVGLIVDGEGDFASMRRRFSQGFKVVKTDGPRGHAAVASEIVSRARKQTLMLAAFECDLVVIILDFEGRAMPYDDFVADLRTQIERARCPVSIVVAVPNRMIENWYLADIEFLSNQKSFLREGLRQRPFEGKNGKAELKRLMRRGTSYSETKHGPELFEILRFDVARKNSRSFDAFLSCLEQSPSFSQS